MGQLLHRSARTTEAIRLAIQRSQESVRVLAAIMADRNSSQKHVWRAKVVLLTADRVGTTEMMRQTGLFKPSIWRWQDRYLEAGVDGSPWPATCRMASRLDDLYAL